MPEAAGVLVIVGVEAPEGIVLVTGLFFEQIELEQVNADDRLGLLIVVAGFELLVQPWRS